MIVRIRVLYIIIIMKSEVWLICHCLGLGHEIMVNMRSMSFYILIWKIYSSHYIKFIQIVSDLDNGFSHIRRQAIMNWCWFIDHRTMKTNFSGFLINMQRFLFKKLHFKMPSAECWSFCLSQNVLIVYGSVISSATWVDGVSFSVWFWWHEFEYNVFSLDLSS